MPSQAQHRVCSQFCPGLEHFVATHAASLGFPPGRPPPGAAPPGAAAAPGVREPSARQVQGRGSLSVRSGPGAQLRLQAAWRPSFSKHCMPSPAQHIVCLQLSPGREHFSATHAAGFIASSFTVDVPGVRGPRAVQFQGWSSVSAGSGPGTQEGLHVAQRPCLAKHCIPLQAQHRVPLQSCPGFEHFVPTHFARTGFIGWASPGVRSPSFSQLQWCGFTSVRSGPGTQEALQDAQWPFFL
mmetsp:Transcript_10098/g.28441  ORF Transcript_10098/g.28441 Transcript_10098/m.28441 type:complete len:240 (+) Transcript_10098:840-1559(+)